MTNPAGTVVPREARDFGNYELIAKLATGGMAEIFLARKSGAGVDDLVVIKRILPHLAEDEHFVTMFRDEANLASKLEHPNVCRVYSLGQASGTSFIVMEYLHGVALSRMLTKMARNRQQLDLRLVATIVIEACQGLQHAHDLKASDGSLLNVVHRDVSPPNIFIGADGHVKLLDFGIAKARGASSKTRTGTVKGKNAYMSPEQILGKPLDRRSDVFALGAVMYELVAVKRLFHRDSDFLTFKAITEEAIPDVKDRRPDLPTGFREVIHRALARDVAARFASANDMAEAVRRAVEPLGGPAPAGDIARIINTDFAEELAAKEVLAEQSASLPINADSNSVPTLQVSSGQHAAVAPTIVDRPRRGNALPALDGELATPPARPTGTPPPIPQGPRVVADLGGRNKPPTLPPPSESTLPQVAAAVAPMAMAPETGETMTAHNLSVDISTDLLGMRRKRFITRMFLGGALVLVLGLFFLLRGSSETSSGAAPADAGAEPVAKRPLTSDTDAGVSKNDIKKYAKKGYFSIDADDKTVVYIDGIRIGELPPAIHQLPLDPGPHKVRLVGPKRKEKTFNEVVILGGQDTDYGKISWSD